MPLCGSAFYRYPSQIARNVRVTCSRTCAARHFRVKGTTVSCVRNKPFYRRRSIAEKGFGRFYSHACELKARNRNGPVERTCLQCNTVFSKDHWSGRRMGFSRRYRAFQSRDWRSGFFLELEPPSDHDPKGPRAPRLRWSRRCYQGRRR